MNILVVSKRFTSKRDCALERFGRAYEIARSLSSLDNFVKLLYIDYRKLEDFSYKAKSFEIKVVSMLSLPYVLLSLVRNEKYDIVIGMTDAMCGIIGFLISRKTKRPFIYEIQDNYDRYDLMKLPLVKSVERYVARSSDLAICASEALKDKYEKIGARKVMTITHGIDLSKFRIIDKTDARRRLNLPQEKVLIAYSGSLDDVYGLDLLVKGYDILSENSRGFALILAGDGSFKHKVRGRKDIILLNIPHHKIHILLNAADILVIPYLRHDLTNHCDYPLKLLEYMAVNKPIVSTDFGNIGKMIRRGSLLVSNEPEELSKLVLKTLSDNEPIDYRKTASEYSWTSMAEKLSTILANLKDREHLCCSADN